MGWGVEVSGRVWGEWSDAGSDERWDERVCVVRCWLGCWLGGGAPRSAC